jgi:hypothetical protein
MATSLQLVLFCLAAVLGVTVAKQYDWNWKEGRATFYGERQGLAQLHLSVNCIQDSPGQMHHVLSTGPDQYASYRY